MIDTLCYGLCDGYFVFVLFDGFSVFWSLSWLMSVLSTLCHVFSVFYSLSWILCVLFSVMHSMCSFLCDWHSATLSYLLCLLCVCLCILALWYTIQNTISDTHTTYHNTNLYSTRHHDIKQHKIYYAIHVNTIKTWQHYKKYDNTMQLRTLL